MTVSGRILIWAAIATVLVLPAVGDEVHPVYSPSNPLMWSRPKDKVPFPAIKDWNSLRISLSRSGCYGTCPIYSVEIAGDGTVTYLGERFVAVKGGQSARIPVEKVRALFDAFVKVDFFWTFDRYEAPITDLPTQVVTISFDGVRKTVVDYAGQRAGMPKAIDDLEEAVDAAAGTARWVRKKE